ncbi:AraC family transcriptional regulator [Paenibacillus sp. HJL G12]|uniref:AraC family transcriptional regulator n=1 Tax=Paenibacillus dendrobii TaxID=2691084 RepID=A0A7X3IF49_9BACL|nr:AraC family transcriptional regulator [Paenibacillus dendrobii]MWV42166.1 AraC family transcriptional regulator [Paenibacillus dendrobii]
MNSNQLFFYIHYCNGRNMKEPVRHPRKFSRTLSHHELILVTGGAGSITLGSKKYPVQEGMLYYIGPGVFHSFEPNPAQPASFLTVHFSYARVILQEGEWGVLDEVPSLGLQPAQSLKDAYPALDLFHKLVDCWNVKLPAYEFMSKTLLQQLLIAIFQYVKKQHQSDATSLKVEKIIEYMHLHISGKITLTELSDLVQLAPTYLSRTFKETTGYSVIEFFNKIKIDKSKELLIEGDKKVKEVAQALGFTDEFYFSRIFKKYEGISPSEYYSKNVHGI